MKINQNMSAVRANSQLLRTEKKLSVSIERLSSGYKINKPGDNPAGMAISNKMRAQIAALNQAESNVSDGVSVMQIADGALNEVSSILQRMRELTVQAANGTNCLEDRQTIQAEIEQLRQEVDRVSGDTEYNTKNLLDGSSDVRVYAEPTAASRIAVSDSVVVGKYSVNITEAAKKAETTMTIPTADPINVEGTFSVNGVAINLTKDMSQDDFYQAMQDGLAEAGCSAQWSGNSMTITSERYGSSAAIEISATADIDAAFGLGGTLNTETNMFEKIETGKDAQVSIPTDYENAGFSSTTLVSADGNRIKISDFNGFSIDFLLDEKFDPTAAGATAPDPANGNFTLDVTEIGAMTIQSGGNQYQTMKLSIPEVSSETLYLDTIDVTVSQGAKRALSTLDDAMARLNEVRSRIGAFQNRLEYASESLGETEEDMTSAYSTLIDTDMAEEMVVYTQQNVLQQAATSVLSQANDLPQTVLSLLQ